MGEEEEKRLEKLRQMVVRHWATLPPDFSIARKTFGELVDFIDSNLEIRKD
jgi:hypothetical protein